LSNTRVAYLMRWREERKKRSIDTMPRLLAASASEPPKSTFTQHLPLNLRKPNIALLRIVRDLVHRRIGRECCRRRLKLEVIHDQREHHAKLQLGEFATCEYGCQLSVRQGTRYMLTEAASDASTCSHVSSSVLRRGNEERTERHHRPCSWVELSMCVQPSFWLEFLDSLRIPGTGSIFRVFGGTTA
jgi:hypothetical protein